VSLISSLLYAWVIPMAGKFFLKPPYICFSAVLPEDLAGNLCVYLLPPLDSEGSP